MTDICEEDTVMFTQWGHSEMIFADIDCAVTAPLSSAVTAPLSSAVGHRVYLELL